MHVTCQRLLTQAAGLISISSGYWCIPMAKTETLNLRVSTEFKRRLVDEAAKEKRSVTNYLEVTLGKIWEQQESKGQRKLERNPRG
jgi:hypothetical protein